MIGGSRDGPVGRVSLDNVTPLVVVMDGNVARAVLDRLGAGVEVVGEDRLLAIGIDGFYQASGIVVVVLRGLNSSGVENVLEQVGDTLVGEARGGEVVGRVVAALEDGVEIAIRGVAI